MKLSYIVPIVLAAFLVGCEDEPESAVGGAGMGGGGAGGAGRGGAGGAGAGGQSGPGDNSPPMSTATGMGMVVTGRTMAPITVSTPTVMGGSSTEVSIPMGAQLLDVSGAPITSSGMLEVTITTYNVEAEGKAMFAAAVGTAVEGMNESAIGLTRVGMRIGTTIVGGVPDGIDVTFRVPDSAFFDFRGGLAMGFPVRASLFTGDHTRSMLARVALGAPVARTFTVTQRISDFEIAGAGMSKRGSHVLEALAAALDINYRDLCESLIAAGVAPGGSLNPTVAAAFCEVLANSGINIGPTCAHDAESVLDCPGPSGSPGGG